jgi:hypothetical protein
VLDYLISPDNLRPKLLPSLLENPTVAEDKIAKFAISATRDAIEIMLASARVKAAPLILRTLKSNPYLRKNESEQMDTLLGGVTPKVVAPAATPTAAAPVAAATGTAKSIAPSAVDSQAAAQSVTEAAPAADADDAPESAEEIPDEAVTAYMAEHAGEIAAEKDKPFQAIGGVVDLLGADYFPVSQVVDVAEQEAAEVAAEKSAAAARPRAVKNPEAPKRENALQKINRLDIKGRIQLALKGNKEERSLLIRDGTKVVALAVLEAPKLSDGEVEKFASQKNVLEAVLRQIPLKRRFMKNYIVVRNLVANPRTPLDLGLGLMKNLLANDLKNISGNKEISETIRKLALKMYKQKLDAANKK